MSEHCHRRRLLTAIAFCFVLGGHCVGQKLFLDSTMHHLRNVEPREWSEFPLKAEGRDLTVRFNVVVSPTPMTISLRQYDVKQRWTVSVNEKPVGTLEVDEKDLIAYFEIPAGILHDGNNVLRIASSATSSDDIKVGEIILHAWPKDRVLSESRVDVRITDTDTKDLLPGRVTIVDQRGVLQSVATTGQGMLAVRPGYVYTGDGHAQITLPAGVYTIYAGRGFEYGVDSMRVELTADDRVEKTFQIRREVSTEGWVSSDTHIHTLTHSGHGDATLQDRAITIAGEGIELPVLTDHNINVDLTPTVKELGLERYFTPVTGNELTTKVGHFNVFPTKPGSPAIDHGAGDWNKVAENIRVSNSPPVVILNHAQDIHNDFRPFDARHHVSAAGVVKRGWKFPANAMEVMNSGSQQTDIMALCRDWFGMLNRGYFLTPVGSSDSHDVSRYTVGQGRTYIRSDDADVSNIDIATAVKNFLDGKVMVSLGLLTKITVNDGYGPGELVPASDKVSVRVEVCGPAWAKANRVTLYANGKAIMKEEIATPDAAGVKGVFTWEIPRPRQDIFLVAIAEGPGDEMPYWPIAKPYQPQSPDWQPKLFGSSGAVWFDADGNGTANCAYDYARKITDDSEGDAVSAIKQLASYDEAVAIQAATLLLEDGKVLTSEDVMKALRRATAPVRSGFEMVIHEAQR